MSKLLSTINLLEGITHIEDLPIQEFIRTVKSVKEKIVTEKLDGANLWFGLDETGFFTSREGKSPKRGRFYSVNDYPDNANSNAFRAAHVALEKVVPTIRKFLKVGDMVEMEVLFGRQPNTVTYGVEGKNFIVILRGVNSTPQDRVDNLSKALNGKKVDVTSMVVSSPDGDTLEENDEQMVWEFTNVAPIEAEKIDTKAATKLLDQMEKFVAEKNKEFPDLTNGQVAELSLTQVPKDKRAEAKTERERVNAYIMDTYKAPIKEMLLNNFVRKVKPFLQDDNLHPSEDIGVEGVVVRDPVTGSQTKIVDKDVFTAINTFNSAVRANIAGLVRTTDQDKPVEMRGGAFGEARIRIAELMGAKELALASGTKRFISKFKKSEPMATAQAVANSLNINSVASTRTKIAAILENALKEVNGILQQFKEEAGEFKLTLKTGKEIGISPEVMKRTLTAFAETKKDINEVRAQVLQSRTAADLVMALYGKTIEAVSDGEEGEVKESFNLIKSINEDGEAAGGGAAAGGAPAATGAGATGGSVPAQTGSLGPGFTGAGAADASKAGTTRVGNIAPYPFKLFKNKVVMKRSRNFTRPKKFPIPVMDPKGAKMGVPESKFSLLKMSEDWAHLKDMKFATDVDDTAHGQTDVEFKQLRNNVNMGDNVTSMDVNRYLDKAHEINDEVDSVVFGMEMDDGSVVKVYVNATQADAFEKALSDMLGKEDNIENVVNDLADKFDIVDVEWPEGVNTGEEPVIAGDESEDVEDENPDIDMTIYNDEDSGEPEETDIDTEASPKGQEEEGGEETEGEGEEEPEGEEEEGGEERDEFGQIIKKKKKKAETTEENLKAVGNLLKEMAVFEAANPTFSNPAVQAVSDMLIAMGFDVNANRSFSYQAKILQAKNTPGMVTAKNSAVSQKIKIARDALENAVAATQTPAAGAAAPATAGTQQNQGFSLIGSIISEADAGWMVADLGSLGYQVSTRGMLIKVGGEEAASLRSALRAGKPLSVMSTNGNTYVFTPEEDGGFAVVQKDKPSSKKTMTSPEVDKLIKELG